MAEADYERDPTLRLVTDALRAGPGSPEWHDAVARARGTGGGGAAAVRDEHALLYAVREHLASGRAYREVRPGAEFSRRLWGAIEDEAAAAKSASVPTANLVAIVSAAAIVTVVTLAGYFLTRGAGEPPPAPATDLSRILFVDTAAEATFDRPPGNQWRTVGALPLVTSRGAVRPAPATEPVAPPTTDAAAAYIGGALVWDRPIGPADAVSVEAVIRLPKAGDDVTAQVFVTDDATFSDDRSTTSSELVALVHEREASVVLPGGRVAGTTEKLKPDRQVLRVKLMFDAASVAVDAGGKRLFAGEHGLSADRPRHIGVRFLTRAGAAPVDPKDAPGIDSIRVMTPKSP